MQYESLEASGLCPSLTLPLIMAEWLSASRHRRIICDDQQKVLWHNMDPRLSMEQSAGIRIENDHLALRDKKAQAALSGFIECPSLSSTAILLRGAEQPGLHVLQCRRLRVEPFGTAFGLRVICGWDYLEGDFQNFERIFGFTTQETRISRQLLQGKTVQEIVDAERKSPNTIRFHIKNIYQKVDVSSREAFFARLRMFLFE